MRSFRTKLSIVTIALVVLVLASAYVYTRVRLHTLLNSFANEIVSLTHNNALLIDAIYSKEFNSNRRDFNSAVNESLAFSPELVLTTVINEQENIIYDSRYVEVTGTVMPSSDILKTLRIQSGEEYIVNSAYCAADQEVKEKQNTILKALTAKITATQCDLSTTHAVELLYPYVGTNHISVRYLFTYDRIYNWVLLTLGVTILLLLAIILVYLDLYFGIAKPLSALRKAAIEMARGNLKYRVSVKKKNELGTVSNFMNEVARNLEKVITDLEEKERMVSELDVASKIQKNLLTVDTPELPGLEIVGKTRSSTEVGGDIFNYIEVDENQTLIYIGDVTGHGVPACLVMIMVDILLHIFSTMLENVRDIIINVNKNLVPRIDTTFFVTMLLFKWDIRQQRLSYSSAGHEHIVHYHAATNQCEAIKSGGIALGMVFDIEQMIQEKFLTLEDGDAVVAYSDGVTEAANPNGELFGLQQLADVVAQFGTRSAQGIFDGVTKTLSAYIGEAPQRDDITLLVMKHKATTAEDIENRVKKARLSIKEKQLKREQKAVWDWDKPTK